jgi:adenylylsulfate kinase
MEKVSGKGFAIWLTGLPSSGKSTLAYALKHLLSIRGIGAQGLDSDDLRRRLTPHPTYSNEERDWFYDIITFLAELLTDNGVNVLIAATASRRAYREAARARIRRFAEVYVDCSIEVCRARDPKGLWESAGKGEITALPGAGTLYEPPESPEVQVDTSHLSIDEAVHQILDQLDGLGFFMPRIDAAQEKSVGVLFNEKVAQVYDRWYEAKKGMLADWFEKELMSRIGELKPGEKILDVGCGTGNHLLYFRKRNMKTIGLDISLPMLRVAQKKIGWENGLCLGRAEALPFRMKSFDCVFMIATLEFLEDPLRALQEATRVSRKKIILGVLNKYSLTAVSRRIKGIFRPTIYNKATFYSIWELKKLLIEVLGKGDTKWGSALILPLSFQQWFGSLENILSFRKNPFGAFLVVGIWVNTNPD